jgi:hypothetical protein
VRNRIFREVLGLAWVREKESELHLGEPLRRWLNAPPEEREDFVLRGSALDEALAWAEAHRETLSEQEHEFLQASQDIARRETAYELEVAESSAQLEREKREQAEELARLAEKVARLAVERAKLARRVIWFLLALVLVLLGSLGVAMWLLLRANYGL